MTKLSTGEIPIDQLHFRLLALLGLTAAGDVNQRLSQGDGKRDGEARFG
jgi:hypothetical protein